MFPNGAPPNLAQSDSAGFAPGTHEYGFKRLHFKNLDPASVRSEVHIKKTPWTFSLTPPLPSGPMIDPYYVWNKIVLTYTKCALTKEKDRLVAISAVAKQIQSMTKDEYLAGLWRRHLEYNLLWFADQSDTNRARAKDYVAPSWSWASMTSREEPYKCGIQPFIYIRPDNPTMIQVLDFRVETVTQDMMGQVSSGFIKLRGWLKQFSLAEDKSWTLRLDPPQIARAAQFDEWKPREDDEEIWFLPIVCIGPWVECEVFGLLLEEAGKDQFKRIGRFRARSDIARTFRRPAYPIQKHDKEEGSFVSSSESGDRGLKNRDKTGWFGVRKKVDEKNTWTERVFTII